MSRCAPYPASRAARTHNYGSEPDEHRTESGRDHRRFRDRLRTGGAQRVGDQLAMAGIASGGNKLSPNPNVTAPAGFWGDQWGANGGGVTPIGGGVAGQTGWETKEANALSTGQTQGNYQTTGSAAGPFTRNPATRDIMSDASRGQLSMRSADLNIPAGGSTVG